jgi:hypothetical protein
MTTESPAPSSRPRSWLLIALAVVVVALIFSRLWSNGAAVSPPPASPARAANGKQAQPVDPKELKVRLEELEAPKPDQAEMERNPFRFQPRAAPPPPPGPPPGPVAPPVESGPAPPPPPPPIPLKLMGFVDLPGGGKVAALSDCKGATFSAAEGKTVDGQYRVVKIGIESITIEFINGKGRQTLRVEGCPPRDR